jgi:O-antigen ligase
MLTNTVETQPTHPALAAGGDPTSRRLREPLWTVPFLCLVVYLLMLFGRVQELLHMTELRLAVVALSLGLLLIVLRNLLSGCLLLRMTWPQIPLMAAFNAWVIASALLAMDPGLVPGRAGSHVKSLLFVLFLTNAIESWRQIRALISLSSLMLLVPVIAGGATMVARGGERLHWRGHFGDPNTLGTYLVLLLPWVIHLCRHARTAAQRRLWLAVGALYIAGVAATGSRSSLITLGVCVFLYWLQARRRALLAAIIVAVTAAGILALPQATEKRYAALADSETWASGTGRVDLWREGLTMMADNPVFGVGPRGFSQELHRAHEQEGGWHVTASRSHNTYLQIAAEVGLPALAIAGCVWLACFLDARRIALGRVAGTATPEMSAFAGTQTIVLLTMLAAFVAGDYADDAPIYMNLALVVCLKQLCQDKLQLSQQSS